MVGWDKLDDKGASDNAFNCQVVVHHRLKTAEFWGQCCVKTLCLQMPASHVGAGSSSQCFTSDSAPH